MFNVAELRAFSAIARTGNFTRASEYLHLSQPALSRRIGALEEAIGAKLFDRFRNGAQLTAVGQSFLPFAENALATIQDGLEAARGTSQGETGTLTLAIAGSLCSKRVVQKLTEFRREYRGIDLSIFAGTSAEVSERVARSEAALGFRFRRDTNKVLQSEVVGQEQLVLVCSSKHALAKMRKVSRELAMNETWISIPNGPSDPLESSQNIFRHHGLTGSKTMVVDNYVARKRFIEAGFGIGILPYGTVEDEVRQGSLRVLKIDDARPAVPVAVVYRRGAYISRAAQKLTTLVASAFPREARTARR